MDDPLPVRLVQRVGDLDAVSQRRLERQRTLRQPIRERLALEQLHHQVLGLPLPPHVVQGTYMRMRELRDRLRLALEALAHLGRRDMCCGSTFTATVRSRRVSRAL